MRARYPDAASERNYYTRPERLTEFHAAHAGSATVVIDEIQRVPELLSMVHRHIELDKSRRFVLTGSSARKLRREGVDLLAGRAVLCSMHPFMAAEMGGGFDLKSAGSSQPESRLLPRATRGGRRGQGAETGSATRYRPGPGTARLALGDEQERTVRDSVQLEVRRRRCRKR